MMFAYPYKTPYRTSSAVPVYARANNSNTGAAASGRIENKKNNKVKRRQTHTDGADVILRKKK